MIKTPKQLKLESALADCRSTSTSLQRPVYVQWLEIKQDYGLTYRMPLMGEWYTSDGIRHGQ